MTVIQEKICTILGWRWYRYDYKRHGQRGGVWIDRIVSFEAERPKYRVRNVRLAKPSDFTSSKNTVHDPSYDGIPKFETDLNAMNDAEASLEHPEAYAARLGPILLRDKSISNLDGTTAWHFAFAHATAAQRAEAFILTHNKPKSKKRK